MVFPGFHVVFARFCVEFACLGTLACLQASP
jgi:hypothetical protein